MFQSKINIWIHRSSIVDGPPHWGWASSNLLKAWVEQKSDKGDFPGGALVQNPSANAGNMGLIPGPGRFHVLQGNQAHTPQPLSPSLELQLLSMCAAAIEAHEPSTRAPQDKPAHWEVHAPQLESRPIHCN